MVCVHLEYQREYIAELCDRLVPLIEDELADTGTESYHELFKDLACRLKITAEAVRQCKDTNRSK